MILYVYAIYCLRINRSLLSESFLYLYQQKETGEITINQESDLLRQEVQQIRLAEMLKKSLHSCFRKIMCFSPPS